MERKLFFKQFRFIFSIGLAIVLISSPTRAQDIYSVDLVTPSYVEANTVLSLRGDDNYLDVPLPFSFTFYKIAYTHAYVSTNGFLSFIRGTPSPSNVSLPSTAIPNGAIYAFWDDLDVDNLSSVRTQLLGTAPNRQFVIEWRNVGFSGVDFRKRIDFEIVLQENGVFLLQYRNIASDGREMGNSATVGVEDETGNSAVLVSYNKAAIAVGEFAIRFAHLARSVPVDIKPRTCPNRLNVDSDGVLRVAILGTSNLDVTTIDPKTVTMAGVAVLSKQENPLKDKKKIKLVASKLRHQGWRFEDVGTPYSPFDGKTDPNQCNNLGPDGHMDIVLTFDTEAIADSLGDVEDKEPITLQLRGQLRDGTEITGEDVVIIMEKRKGHAWSRGHDGHDRGHHKGHDKDREHDCDGKHD